MQKGQFGWTLRQLFAVNKIVLEVAGHAGQVDKGRHALARGLHRFYRAKLVSVVAFEHWHPDHPARVLDDVHIGLGDDTLRDRYRRSPAYEDSRLDLLSRRMLDHRRHVLIKTRPELIPDQEWRDYPVAASLAQLGLGDLLCGAIILPGNGALTVGIHLPVGKTLAEDGSHKEALRAILHSLRQLYRKHDIGAAGPRELPSTAGLTRRELEVLRHLLAGKGTKQIAVELSVKDQTVAGYIKAVYRHFVVHSRGELMAKFLRA